MEFPDHMFEFRLYNYDENHVILELPAIFKRHILPKKEFITSWIQAAIRFYETLALSVTITEFIMNRIFCLDSFTSFKG
ncbi:hypothetical protein DS745_23410 [Anaerobacillus alkaliphilus]|uniref:Uncharacterized protein n=1 Tax=Anaerobacillus alkaliphilus TaxID=1548597 RepID=A0A4Q0VP29_9BACI|nr:hypothetical protein DS745_23410 [Anaerobacillus alkaliphilus]